MLYPVPLKVTDTKLSFFGGLEVIKVGSKITLAQVGQTAIITLPAIVAGRSLGIDGLGMFRAIFDLASRVWFISNGFGLVIFPVFAKMRIRFPLTSSNIFRSVSSTSSVFYLMLLSLGILLSPQLIKFIHLDSQSLPLMTLIIIGMLMNAHSNTMYEMIQSIRQPILLAIVSLVACLPYLIVWQAQNYTPEAAGMIWIISQTVYLILMDVIYIYALGRSIIFIRKLLDTILFVSISLAFWFFRDNWFSYLVFAFSLVKFLNGMIKMRANWSNEAIV